MRQGIITAVTAAALSMAMVGGIPISQPEKYIEAIATEAEMQAPVRNITIIIEESEATAGEPETLAVREVTDEEYELLLRVCMSECGGQWGEPHEGKVAVVETILNRVDMGWGSIEEVIYKENQYSTADNGEPDHTVSAAVDEALSRSQHPDSMIYFRTERYHAFGQPYEKIGNHYFSLEEE